MQRHFTRLFIHNKTSTPKHHSARTSSIFKLNLPFFLFRNYRHQKNKPYEQNSKDIWKIRSIATCAPAQVKTYIMTGETTVNKLEITVFSKHLSWIDEIIKININENAISITQFQCSNSPIKPLKLYLEHSQLPPPTIMSDIDLLNAKPAGKARPKYTKYSQPSLNLLWPQTPRLSEQNLTNKWRPYCPITSLITTSTTLTKLNTIQKLAPSYIAIKIRDPKLNAAAPVNPASPYTPRGSIFFRGMESA